MALVTQATANCYTLPAKFHAQHAIRTAERPADKNATSLYSQEHYVYKYGYACRTAWHRQGQLSSLYSELNDNQLIVKWQEYWHTFDVEYIYGFVWWGVCKQSRWRHCVTEPSQDGEYALLWQRYDNNKMAAICYSTSSTVQS